jgi:trans-aconitate 2-methyltransferase
VTFGQRFARFVTNVVTRAPFLWRLFRGPLTRMFDRLAVDWDATRVSEQHLAPLAAALDRIEAAPAHVLDLGTGTGAAVRLVAARWPQAEVVGVDMSEEMIRDAQARATSPHQRYEVADASALPYPADAFELVTLLNMIPFYDELARVTAPGGSVVVAFSRGSQTPIYVPPERVRAELERRGFSHVADIAAGAGTAVLAEKRNRS